MNNHHPHIHPAFELIKSESIKSLQVELEHYRHKKTGAEHYHLACDKDENVFLVALRTIPKDSTGVAHILEHSVLCGSERYPVRDPFFMMIRRSLNTFMNAFTSTDWTAYPFASKNRKDFNNLLNVYLDSVFFSRLHELDFAQEGHRFEFETKDNPNSPLQFKGVVYNEMKGAMSSPVSTAWHTLCKYLFPSTTYHFNSGGEPEDIPDLSYQQLMDFYRLHYHPSNAIFMTFGDIPAFEHHQTFQENVLSRFESLDIQMEVNCEKRYLSPIYVNESYALDSNAGTKNKSQLIMAWLLGESTDLEHQLCAQMLSEILLSNSASPLLRALEQTDLGQSPSPLCGLENSNRELSFVCGLEGADEDSIKAFEKLVFDVLNQVAQEGVEQELIDSVLHQLELSQLEIGGNHYPYGLQLILNGLSAAVHRGSVIDSLDRERVLNRIREKVKKPNFVQQLVKELLLDNQHRVSLTMRPDEKLSQKKAAAERQRLDKIAASLSSAQKKEIVEQGLKLEQRQLQQDDDSVLPKLELDDIPQSISQAEGKFFNTRVGNIAQYIQGTNGLAYVQIALKLNLLNEQQLMMLPFFSYCVGELGFDKLSFVDAQLKQNLLSGGLSAHSSLRNHLDSEQSAMSYYVFSSKSLHRNFSAMLELLHACFSKLRFDEHDKIKELLAQYRQQKEHSITGAGHRYAMLSASSGMSPLLHLEHQNDGMYGIKKIIELDQQINADNDPDSLQQLTDLLVSIHQQLLICERQFLLVTEDSVAEQQRELIEKTWDAQQQTSHVDFIALKKVRTTEQQAWITSTQVNFCAKSYPTVTAKHPDAPILMVLAAFLKNGYLHRAIRENGGAYGGGAVQQNNHACFNFFSYRDPRLKETLEDFDRSIQWLVDNEHSEQALEEAILSVIARLDQPFSPAGEAKNSFSNHLFERSLEHRQKFRQAIIGVRIDDLKRVARQYFSVERASTAVLSNKENKALCEQLGLSINTIN